MYLYMFEILVTPRTLSMPTKKKHGSLYLARSALTCTPYTTTAACRRYGTSSRANELKTKSITVDGHDWLLSCALERAV